MAGKQEAATKLPFDLAYETLADLFQHSDPENPSELRAIGDGPPHTLMTRDANKMAEFMRDHDRPGRSVYVGVNPRKPGVKSGSRDNLAEAVASFLDIDCDKDGVDRDATLKALRECRYPPSRIHNSGGGIHAFWRFKEPVDIATDSPDGETNGAQVEDINKGLARVFAGDPACVDLARIVRLPGTHNTKYAAPRLCDVVEVSGFEYDSDELAEWIDDQPPLLTKAPANNANSNRFEDHGARYDAARVDVDTELKAMAEGRADVHTTQLRVSAALVTRGWKDDAITKLLLKYTRPVEGLRREQWDWKAEERAIRGMIADARKKGYDAPQAAPGEATDAAWGPLGKLPPPIPTAPEMPPELLPDTMRPWLVDESERMGVPLDYFAVPAMIGAATVVGRQCVVRPKQHDDWEVVPNLWGCVSDPPGARKSPAASKALVPVRDLERDAADQFEKTRIKNQVSQDALKAKEAALSGRLKGLHTPKKNGDAEEGDQAEIERDLIEVRRQIEEGEPAQRRYTTSDTTQAALGEVLKANPNGVAVVQDELFGWINGLDKPGNEGDREFYLAAWSGDVPLKIDRIGRGHINLPAVCVSVFGTTQPGKIQALVEGAISGKAASDGFLQRLQLMVSPDRSEVVYSVDRPPDKAARDRAVEAIKNLDLLNPNPAKGDPVKPLVFHFDPKAQKAFSDWDRQHEGRLKSGELDGCPALAGHLAKFNSLVPTLALLFHLVEGGRGAIGLSSVVLALNWADYLEQHARKIYAPETNRPLFAAERIMEMIVQKAALDGSEVRDLYRAGRKGLKTADDAHAGITVLKQINAVRIEEVPPGPTGGQPKGVLRIHPDLRG